MTRTSGIAELKTNYPDRVDLIDQVVTAFDDYSPFKGQLDDPRDLQRMLKGAGILEWRILPTRDRTELTEAEIERYTSALGEKGPKAASDGRYIWCAIEDITKWGARNTIVSEQRGRGIFINGGTVVKDNYIRKTTGGSGIRIWAFNKPIEVTGNYVEAKLGNALRMNDAKGAIVTDNVLICYDRDPIQLNDSPDVKLARNKKHQGQPVPPELRREPPEPPK